MARKVDFRVQWGLELTPNDRMRTIFERLIVVIYDHLDDLISICSFVRKA